MNVSEVMEKMIKESKGSFRDINHFLKVWGYARNIGKGENLDDNTQKTLEIAAIVHDISCPSLREKYGEADGKKQEEVSSPMIRKFFEGSDISKSMILIKIFLRFKVLPNCCGLSVGERRNAKLYEKTQA